MTSSMQVGSSHREAMGARIRALRHARGLTLHALGGLVDVSAATLSAIETGKTGVSSERALHLARALDVAVEQLFTGDPALGLADGSAGGPLAPPPERLTHEADWRVFSPLPMDVALTAALSSFVEYGYHGASMRTIAERSGLSVPGLYHYYPSKQDMLVALLELTMSDLHDRMSAAAQAAEGTVECFTNIVECLALVHTHRRDLAFVGASEMRSLLPEARARVAATRMREQRQVDAAVEAGVRDGYFHTERPHEAARAVVTMCTALAQWFRGDGPAPAEDVARQYVDFALGLVRFQPRP